MQHHPSPNFDHRAGDITMLLFHYTGMASAEAARMRMCDPAAKVSAHYLIGGDGRVTRLVDEANRAWHAGKAYWAGISDINSAAIGIEIQNPGHEFGYQPFTDSQIESIITLAREILGRHDIPAGRVLGHSDVAPGRKQDPGELFPWARLAGQGIGLWPGAPAPGAPGDDGELRGLLTRVGYDPGAPLGAVITAFQRHWQPEKVDGVADQVTWGRLRALL